MNENRRHRTSGWRRAAGAGVALIAIMGFTAIGQAAALQATLEGMEHHLGQRFEARLLDVEAERVVSRTLIETLDSGRFALSFDNLIVGRTYRLEFSADMNGNGLYDAPPEDHAWRIDLTDVTEEQQVSFQHGTEFTDLGWSRFSPGGGVEPELEPRLELAKLVDGRIGSDEYARYQWDRETGIGVYWRSDKDTLTLGLISPGSGWVSVGFDPVSAMQGADYILSGVRGQNLTIEDHFGTGRFSHRLDAQQDILESAGRESDGETIVEFRIPRNSGDAEDKVLVSGAHVLLLAYHTSSDSFAVRHSARSTSVIILD